MNAPQKWSTKAIDNHFKSHKSSCSSLIFSKTNRMRCTKSISTHLSFKYAVFAHENLNSGFKSSLFKGPRARSQFAFSKKSLGFGI